MVDDFIRNARVSSNGPPGFSSAPPTPHLWSFTLLGAFVLKKPPSRNFIFLSKYNRQNPSAFLHTQAHTPVSLLSHIHNYTHPSYTMSLSVMSRFCMISHVSGYSHPHKLINCIINLISAADDCLLQDPHQHIQNSCIIESLLCVTYSSAI